MAGKQKKKAAAKKAVKKHRLGWKIGIAAFGALTLGMFALHVNARIVHVRYAEVALEDLPASFDGTTLLFVSDLDLCGLNSVSDAEKLFDRLQALNPDLLLLGGDYASASLLERLNGRTGADESETRRTLFRALSDFEAPMGKLAVSGDNDGDADALQFAMMDSGVELIDGNIVTLRRGSDELTIVGIGEETDDLRAISGALRSDACVIALMHQPEKLVAMQIAEAADGGTWVDLALAGHTHGGQINLAGRSLLSLDDTAKRYLIGWYSGIAPLLVTQGVGCEGINLRFGTQAEVWLITLRAK